MFKCGDPDRLVSRQFLAEIPCVAEAASTPQHQYEAAAALVDHSNEEIFAWLKLVRSARSIEPIPEQRSGSAYLSPSQIHALSVLKACPNDRIVECLELAHLCRNDPTTTAFALSPFVNAGLSNNPSSPLGPSDPTLFEAKLWMGPTEQSSSQPTFSPGSRLLAADDLFGYSVNSISSGHTKKHYWCTVCESPKSYRDSGNWKKHEKEHETIFVCELDHAAQDSRVGPNPGTKAFSCKRRDIMVNHLNKSHGIFAVQAGRDLADKWRVTVTKQAWSCGFCGSLFLNFKDRLRHIDTEHFKKYEGIQRWDSNKVIHGLLLQPKMEKAWKERTASLSSWVQTEDIVWTEAFAKNMRTKLEIGPSDEKDANRLADEVYSASKLKKSLNESGMAAGTVSRSGIAGAISSSSPTQDRTLSAQASGSAPEHRQRPSITRATAYLAGNSPFGQHLGHSYDHGSSAVPPMASLDEVSRGTYNAPSFYPSQDSVATLEGGIGYVGYDQAVNEASRGFRCSTGNWNGQ